MVRVERLDTWLSAYGKDAVLALILVFVALLAAGLLSTLLKGAMRKAKIEEKWVSLGGKILYGVLIVSGVMVALYVLGFQISSIRRIILLVCLGATVITMVMRRYYPSMPFKRGDTVEAAGNLGQVEGVTVLNTKLKTFDGKTMFIPNRKILNETLINYHFTPNRQIRLVFSITYDSDLLKAKAALAEILTEDPRVLANPPPRVFVIDLGENSVDVAARPWTKNSEYFKTRCDLLEKIKLRFDLEGIKFAFPQRDLHLREEGRVILNTAAPRDGVTA
jgi:small conductance mechanosensitive channel